MNRMALTNIYDTSVLLEVRTNYKKHWTEKWPFHAFEFSNLGGARNFWGVGSERPMAAILRGPWQIPPPILSSKVSPWVFVVSKSSVRRETGHMRDHTQSRRGASQKPFPCN